MAGWLDALPPQAAGGGTVSAVRPLRYVAAKGSHLCLAGTWPSVCHAVQLFPSAMATPVSFMPEEPIGSVHGGRYKRRSRKPHVKTWHLKTLLVSARTVVDAKALQLWYYILGSGVSFRSMGGFKQACKIALELSFDKSKLNILYFHIRERLHCPL